MEELRKIDILNLEKNNIGLNSLKQKIESGKAILFTGAGFSTGAKNIKNTEPPRAKELAKLIAKKGDFDGEGDLKFSSNYFLRIKDESILVNLLREQYTLKNISQAHKNICAVPWKRIYTTNYDNSIDIGYKENNINGQCITLNEDPTIYFKKKNICVHINGNINSLKNDKIPTDFKLSTASYLSADSFISSKWFSSFKKDLERCSAIVFIGYSLYDIEIQKILFESPHFKEKTFFITHQEATKKSIFELSEYGKVFNIGIENFSKDIIEKLDIQDNNKKEWFDSFEKYSISSSENEIDDQSIIEFLLHGKLKSHFIDEAIAGTQTLPYLIIENKLDKSIELLKECQYLTILSDFGNGKTIFLNLLASYLTLNGKTVYILHDIEGNYIDDIDKLVEQNSNAYIIIDDYENSLDLIKYIQLNNSNLKVILSTRSSNQSRLLDTFDEKLNTYEFNIDILDDNEINSFSKILENVALWSNKAGLSEKAKFNLIKDQHKSQISHTLLNILNAPQIVSKINQILEKIFQTKDFKDTIFAISILEIMNIPLMYSTISDIALNHRIYSTELLKHPDFIQLYTTRQNEISTKSSLFARTLLKNHFDGVYTTNKLLDIVEKFQSLRDNGEIEATIYRNLLKFSFIERSLPNENKRNMLIKYYEQLKSRINGLEKTPHFWLQYAMARIAIEDYTNAKNCLETAYAKAYDNYDTSYLDAQQARLWILMAQKEIDQIKSINYFTKAHNLLKHLHDDQYKYRQVEAYQEYYKKKYSLLSKKNRNIFITYVKEMIKKLNSLDELETRYFTETNRIGFCHKKLNEILENI